MITILKHQILFAKHLPVWKYSQFTERWSIGARYSSEDSELYMNLGPLYDFTIQLAALKVDKISKS